MEINYNNYYDIQREYSDLADNQPQIAYYLMKRASAELEYFDRQVAEANKLMIDSEKEAKGIEASTMADYRIAGMSATAADKAVPQDHRVLTGWQIYSDCRKMRDLLQAQADFLERVYFDCKTTYESAYKKIGKSSE